MKAGSVSSFHFHHFREILPYLENETLKCARPARRPGS